MSQPKVGEKYRIQRVHYRVGLVTDNHIVLEKVHGDLDEGMILPKEQWEEMKPVKIEEKLEAEA